MSEVRTTVAAIDNLVQRRTGLCLAMLAEGRRAHVLQSAMRRCGASDLGVYLERLRFDAHAFDDLVADLTVHETYFLRDPAQFAFLHSEVLPALRTLRGADHVLRLWSAGCASGEEAYSLAIVLAQLGLAARSTVLASDISEPALERARKACYGAWSLRGVPSEIIDAFFQRTPDGFQLDETIANSVLFVQHNLVLPRPLAHGARPFDVIFCKNVFIYFSRETMNTVARNLVEVLAPHGWLFTGPSDPLLQLDDLCEVVSTPFGICYKRCHRRPSPNYPQASAAGTGSHELQGPRFRPPARASGSPVPTASRRATDAAHDAPTTRQDWVRSIRQCANRHGSGAAEADCKRLIAREPLFASAHYVHALLLLDLGREEEAEVALGRALFLDESLAVGHFLAGVLAARRGDVRAAHRAYLACQASCTRRPSDEQAELGDGITYFDLQSAARRAAELSQKGLVS